MNLIITRPEHDHTTRYLSLWSEKILETAKKKGINTVDLKGNKATKKELTGRINKLKPSLVILNGHGNKSTVAGHDDEPLVKVGINENILFQRITYAVSCKSAKRLGAKCATKAKTTYIGYDDDFMFTSDLRKSTNPLLDKRAKPFMEASNQVVISLLKGRKAIDASNRSKESFKKSYTKLLSSKATPDNLNDAKLLWWDSHHQQCLGDINKKM